MKSTILSLLCLVSLSCAAQKKESIETNRDGSLILFDNKSEKNTLYVTRDGNMGIGKKKPTDKLEVNGQIHAKAVKVDLKEWADTVFEKEYELDSLREIENHITTHGHLSEIPSAETVLREGIELGEMNRLLLKKIEELTLHLIEKDKQLKNLTQEVEKIKSEMNSLKVKS